MPQSCPYKQDHLCKSFDFAQSVMLFFSAKTALESDKVNKDLLLIQRKFTPELFYTIVMMISSKLTHSPLEFPISVLIPTELNIIYGVHMKKCVLPDSLLLAYIRFHG